MKEKEVAESRGAVEIVAPDESVQLRMEAISTVARACEQLAQALTSPAFAVTINGNITAIGPRNSVVVRNKKKP